MLGALLLMVSGMRYPERRSKAAGERFIVWLFWWEEEEEEGVAKSVCDSCILISFLR